MKGSRTDQLKKIYIITGDSGMHACAFVVAWTYLSNSLCRILEVLSNSTKYSVTEELYFHGLHSACIEACYPSS